MSFGCSCCEYISSPIDKEQSGAGQTAAGEGQTAAGAVADCLSAHNNKVEVRPRAGPCPEEGSRKGGEERDKRRRRRK